jgi:DNA polymerase III epsilon subunit-like protein
MSSGLTLIFDVETTGLVRVGPSPLNLQPFVIEFACVVVDKEMRIVHSYATKVNPGRPISDQITKITGITNEQLKDAPTFGVLFEKIKGFIDICEKVVAHNVAFDCKVMDCDAARIERSIKWPKKVCTVEATEHFKGFRMNLMALHEHLFAEPFKSAHTAMGDVDALYRCYKQLHKMGYV